MIHARNTKVVNVIAPQSIGTTEVTGTIDLLGYDHCAINVHQAAAATTVTVTSLGVSEADSGTEYTAIAALTGGTNTGNFTLPTASGTDTVDLIRFDVNRAGRKRYLKVTLANSAARISAVTAELSKARVAPNSATARGLSLNVQV